MNRLAKAVKQYYGISFTWWTPILALAATGGLGLIALLTAAVSGYDAIGPLIPVIIGAYLHFIAPSFLFLGALRSSDHKFFSSSTYAKSFFTSVPVVSALVMCLPLDILLYIVCGSAPSAEKMIINAVNTVLVCFIASSTNKSGQQIAGLIAVILYMFQFRIWLTPKLMYGFGIPVPAAAAIALIIYIGGTALTIISADMWWDKSGRKMTGRDGLSGDISAIKKVLYILDR